MEQKPRVTPKNFFLQIGSIAAFYMSVVAFITLMFQYIEILFPDQLQGYYDPYSSSIRWSIAILIVIFPVYIWLTRLMNNDLEKDPENQNLGLRRWLTYLTLFVAGITVVISLVAVINVFLGGNLTTVFSLKVLVILVVALVAFGYYLYDLKGYWIRNRGKSKTIGWIALLVVLISIVSGFFIIGSPATQRDLRFDERRVNDLNSIQWQVINYWQQKERLPINLDELEDPISSFMVPTDPESDEVYKYSVKGDLTFELCANFVLPSRDSINSKSLAYPVREINFGIESNWEHKAGENCFERTIDPDKFPPLKR